MIKRAKKLSHKLSRLLRHRAGDVRLPMDAAGWVRISDLLAHVHMSPADLVEVVRDNNKARFQVDGDMIRAAQGHSLEGMPVTQKALEASWDLYAGEDSVWHGTHAGALEGIAAMGILPSGRSHVHLAAELDSRVGKRANVAVMLEVSAAALRSAGHEVFVSANGVVLTRHVPPRCIKGLRAMTKAAQKDETALRATLSLVGA